MEDSIRQRTHRFSEGSFIMLSGGLSRLYSNGPALNGGPCRRGQERAEAEGKKVHGCHSFKALFLVPVAHKCRPYTHTHTHIFR